MPKAFPKRPKTTTELGALEGWLDLIWQLIKSDVYTPTATAVTNVDSTTGRTSSYVRVGDRVEAHGAVEIDPTAGGGAATTVRISLPVASNLTVNYDLVGWAFTTSGDTARIIADTSNNEAQIDLQGGASHTAERRYFFTLSYRIIN